MLGFIEKSFVRRPLRHSVTRYCRKPGFHGSHIRYCLARLIRSFTFASTRPPLGYAQTATSSCFTDSVPDDYATEEVLLAHIKRVDAPSCLNKALIWSAAPLSWMTPRSLHSCHSTAKPPRCLGLTAAPYWIWDRHNDLFGMYVHHPQ